MDPPWVLVVMMYNVMNQKQTAMARANNGSARALYTLVHFFSLQTIKKSPRGITLAWH